jgi:hypothetical protein
MSAALRYCIANILRLWEQLPLTEYEHTSWAFYRDDAGADVDFDILGDIELLLGVDVQHL